MSNYSENSINGGIPLTNVTGKTVYIYKYLDFGFYEKVWFKDNAGLFPSKHGGCLDISQWTFRVMWYHILTHTGTVIYIFRLKWVTNLDLSTDEVKETFVDFYAEIHLRLKSDNSG